MPKTLKFKNGLRFIPISQKGTKAVTLLVLVATGSKYEKKEISGISHLLEHLMFKGTKKRPNQLAVVEPLDRIGGVYNAFTGQEYTGYYIKARADYFDLALNILSDIYLNSKFDLKEIKKEKKVVLEEINMYHDHPMHHVQSLWTNVLYGDQPAGWDIAGTKEGVSDLTRNQIVNYFKGQYTTSNTVVCAAGNLPEGIPEISKKVEKKFSERKEEKTFKKPEVIEGQEKPGILLEQRKTDQTHLCLGVRGYNLSSPQRYPQKVLAALLGGMMSSRLFRKVRQELGLAYYINCQSSSDPDSGYLVSQAGVDNKSAEKAVSAILKEYQEIKKGVPTKELEKAKENLKGKLALGLETSDALASFYSVQEILEGRLLTPESIYDKINKVGVDDIKELAQDIFKPEKLNLALIGPFKNKKKFEDILNE